MYVSTGIKYKSNRELFLLVHPTIHYEFLADFDPKKYILKHKCMVSHLNVNQLFSANALNVQKVYSSIRGLSWKILKNFKSRIVAKMFKGQIISKGLFGVLEFSQKNDRTSEFVVVEETNSFVCFWENSRIPKVLSKICDL